MTTYSERFRSKTNSLHCTCDVPVSLRLGKALQVLKGELSVRVIQNILGVCLEETNLKGDLEGRDESTQVLALQQYSPLTGQKEPPPGSVLRDSALAPPL